MKAGLNAVVTGSTSGIGLGIAEALAAQRANVMVNGLEDQAAGEAIAEDLRTRHNTQTAYAQADLTKPEEVRALVAAAEETFGGSVDVLVNNAGIQYVAPVEDFPEAKWNAIIALNLSSSFHTIKAVMPGMKQKGWGRIINLASAHALVASPFKTAYVAAKHGLLGLTKTVALEGAQSGITANAICPGYVRTPLVESQIPDQAKSRGITEEEVVRDVLLAAQPTKQFVQTDQIGALAVFLCTDAAASITGAALPIDGGWTAQ